MDEEDETPILEVDLIQTHSIKFLKEESNRLLFKLENKFNILACFFDDELFLKKNFTNFERFIIFIETITKIIIRKTIMQRKLTNYIFLKNI